MPNGTGTSHGFLTGNLLSKLYFSLINSPGTVVNLAERVLHLPIGNKNKHALQ